MTTTTNARPVVDVENGVVHVYRPADGSHLADLALHDAAYVGATAKQLRDAQVEWEQLGVRGRMKWLQLMRQWLMDNAATLADLNQAEAGRVRSDCLSEVTLLIECFDYYARVAPDLLAPKQLSSSSKLLLGKRFTVLRRPYPLVGVIGGWNVPLLLSFGDAFPALLAGAAVMLKPSEVTPLAVREMVRGWQEDVGAPPVIDLIIGGGDTGAVLIDEVDFVQFTGSVATGKRVAQRAAETLTPISLELGGKDPCLVLKSANINRAANCAVYGAFANNGQVCMGIERVYVEAPVYDDFVDRVVTKVATLRSGIDGPDVGKELGAMTTPAQLAIVDDHVRDAISKGARVLAGGRQMDRAGNWYEPTVLVDVDHTMKIMREETFGPVLPIMRVADADEAVKFANDSDLGLSATVFAGSVKEGEQIAERLDVGAVNINEFITATICGDVPQGGWKHSGIGSRNADQGLLKYTRAKSIASSRIPTLDNELIWFPYTPARHRLIRTVTRFVQARGLGRFGI